MIFSFLKQYLLAEINGEIFDSTWLYTNNRIRRQKVNFKRPPSKIKNWGRGTFSILFKRIKWLKIIISVFLLGHPVGLYLMTYISM